VSNFISTIVGALVSIGFVIFVEYLRRPRLQLIIIDPFDGPWPSASLVNAQIQEMRSLRLSLCNVAPPWYSNWVLRSPALQCHAAISFYDQQGRHDIFGRSMEGRWAASPEPFIAQTPQGQPIGIIPDWSCVVYPGESETLDLAIRTNVSPNSYGWNNESYFCDPLWRNPRWELLQGIHRVRVIITSSGQKRTFWFTLVNSAGISAFHLE
jgi:hypothetical protein